MKKMLSRLYAYNEWRYTKIFDSLEKKQDIQQFLENDNKLFFNNVLDTLKHNLFADFIWYGRMQQLSELKFNQPQFEINLKELIKLWKSDDPKILSSIPLTYEQTKSLLFQMNQKFRELIEKNNEESLLSSFKYCDSKDQELEKELQLILFHLINHHTHHIGQISTIFTQKYGREDYFSIDLIYFKDDK